MNRAPAPLAKLMLVTDRRGTRGRDIVEVCAEAAEGGVRLVQLREKDLARAELLALALRMRERLPEDTTLLVNGDLEVARAAGAGLHLPAAAVFPGQRAALGVPLLGRSAHDPDEVLAAVGEGVDYVVLGTIFPTSSKAGHPGSGLDFVRRMAALAQAVPIFAIGGVHAANAAQVRAAGVHGVAVQSAILAAEDPAEAARALLSVLR